MNRVGIALATFGACVVLGAGGFAVGQNLFIQSAPVGQNGWLSSPNLTTSNNGTIVINGYYNLSPQPKLPQGSLYHQVVDIYYDSDGNKLDIKSATHMIGYDCNRGLRRQDQELIAQDDGKGNVQFASLRLASEPTTGVKPITQEGLVKARLAINNSLSPEPTEIPIAKEHQTNLAFK